MVLHKRLDYGSRGHQVPPMPRVPTSARGKRSARKKLGGDVQISAFDLLATVAGKLLSERENSLPPYNTEGLKAEIFDQSSCNESTLKNNANLDIGNRTPIQTEKRTCANEKYENVLMTLEDHMNLDSKPPTLISSDSSVEVPLSRNESFPKYNKNREGEEDENSSACTHPCYKYVKAMPQRIGDRKVRKLLASKFWRAPSNDFKNREVSNNDAEMKTSFQSRKMFYTRQRTQKSSFKRRKLVERSSMPEICDQQKFGSVKIEASDALQSLNVGNGASSSTSGDYNVKFSIKAFMVPELFIEISENATIGSLKRTVMEAVSTILAGGMKVGVVHQGKKARDDKQTLFQAGISCETKMDNLGFTLEPNSTQTPPLPSLTCSEDPSSILQSATTEPIQRIQSIAAPTVVVQGAAQVSNLNCPESDHDSILSQDVASSSVDKIDNSKALISVPDITADPLNAIPMRKSRRSELVQRRIRRPFSVTEVEALVQAVEKLGTGRWRDVKIRAFDNAKHRTYVDLKDKWKTLVHTAKISPQQRRGEPVPQELLDRVLSAHAYWTQQQAKLQIKPSLTEQCFLN